MVNIFVPRKQETLTKCEARLTKRAQRERLTSTKHTAWGGDDEGEGEQCARGG